MRARTRSVWMRLSVCLLGGCLLGTGCQTKTFATNLATSTANRLADIFLTAFLVEPVRDAVENTEP